MNITKRWTAQWIAKKLWTTFMPVFENCYHVIMVPFEWQRYWSGKLRYNIPVGRLTWTRLHTMCRLLGITGQSIRIVSAVQVACSTDLSDWGEVDLNSYTSPAAHPTTRLGAWRCHVGLQFNIWRTFHFCRCSGGGGGWGQTQHLDGRAKPTEQTLTARGRPSTGKVHFSVRPPASHCRSQASLEITLRNSHRKCPKTNFHHVHRSRTMSLYAELEGESPVQKQRWSLYFYRCFDFCYCYCLTTSDLFLIPFSISLLPSFVLFLTTPSFPSLIIREAFYMKPVGSTESAVCWLSGVLGAVLAEIEFGTF